MAGTVETLNEAAVSWAECEIVPIIPGAAPLPDIDWKSLDFDETISRGWQRGKGGKKKKKTTGQLESSASGSLYREGLKALKRGLLAVAPQNAEGQYQLSKVRFNIPVTHSYEGDSEIYHFELRGCTLDKNALKLAEGPDADLVDIDLNPTQIVEIIDGKEVVLL